MGYSVAHRRPAAPRRTAVRCGLAGLALLAAAWLGCARRLEAASNTYSDVRAITIDHTKVGESNSVNFPMLVSGTYPFLATVANGGDVQSPSGYDIVFASDSACSSLLSWEQESWSAATGAAIYWVKVPTLLASSDTVIYLCYGNAGITAFQGGPRGAAWDSYYAGVWHLGDGSSLIATDSAANGNDGALSSPAPAPIVGQIGGAAQFDGVDSELIDVGNGATLGVIGNTTFEAWINPSTIGSNFGIFTKETGYNPAPYMFYYNAGNVPCLYLGDTVNKNYCSGNPAPVGAWSHLVATVTVSGDARYDALYLNGAPDPACCGTGNPVTAVVTNGTEDAMIGNGYWGSYSPNMPFDGGIDEVRLSSTARSADWILAEYNNQSSPSTFYSVGSASSSSWVALAPGSLVFSAQEVGTSSGPQSFTLTDTAGTSLSITSIVASGDFSLATTSTSCPYAGGSLASQASCTIDVIFTPRAAGMRTGTLIVTDDSNGVAGNIQMASLSGTATAPVAGISPSSLTFNSQAVGTTSSAQAVTLQNTGSAALAISSIAISGDFTQTHDCGSSVVASDNCTITIAFSPTATGTRTGTLTITDNNNAVAGSTQTVSLSGTATAPMAGISPSSLTFNSQTVGTTSGAQAVTLQNNGSAALTLSSIAISGDFHQTNNCGSSVAANGNCTINVTFSPTASGARTGTLTITDNSNGAANSTQTVRLTGTGTEPPDFTLTAPSGSSATAAPGQTVNYSLSLAGEGGFNQSVTFACAGAPALATCTASPNPAPVANSPVSVTVTVTTTAPSAVAPRILPPTRPRLPAPLVLLVIAAVLAGLAWMARRRRPAGTSWRRALLLSLAMGLLLILAMTGCGGGTPAGRTSVPGTPAGTYTLTVTGSAGSGSHALSHSVTLTLTLT